MIEAVIAKVMIDLGHLDRCTNDNYMAVEDMLVQTIKSLLVMIMATHAHTNTSV